MFTHIEINIPSYPKGSRWIMCCLKGLIFGQLLECQWDCKVNSWQISLWMSNVTLVFFIVKRTQELHDWFLKQLAFNHKGHETELQWDYTETKSPFVCLCFLFKTFVCGISIYQNTQACNVSLVSSDHM